MRGRFLVAAALLTTAWPAEAFGAPVTVGTNTHLPAADALDLAVDLGGEWVRIDFNWYLAEPSNNSYDWSVFDAVIDAAHARGLRVFATIGYGPAWASVSGNRDGESTDNDVPNAAEYQQFVTDATARYADGRVEAWGTWNEPNLEGFFEGTMEEWLANAFGPAIDGIQAGCPSCLVVGPELASIGDNYADYLQAALQARGSDLDVISWHIYSAFPEDDAEAGVSKDSFYNDLEAHRVFEIGGVVVWEGPLSVREVAQAEGFGTTPIWISETGEQAAIDNSSDLEAQRLFVERVVTAQESRAWWDATFFYELTEEHPGGAWPDIHWGLALRVADPDDSFDDNFQRKPAFDWLKNYLATQPDPPDAGPGPDDPDAGPGPTDPDAGTGPGVPDAGTTPGPEPDGAPGADDPDGGGCTCVASGPTAGGSATWLLAALVAFGLRRRRRSRPQRRS